MRPEFRGDNRGSGLAPSNRKVKLGVNAGVFVPVVSNIISILMFLRFGSIMGRIGLIGMLGLLIVAYIVDFITTLSLSAIASNGEVKGGGAYYLISRSLGPEFGGSIGIMFYLAQAVNTSLNIVGLIDCVKLNLGTLVPHGYWESYGMQTAALVLCTGLSLAGRSLFVKASGALTIILTLAIISIPISAISMSPFKDDDSGIEFTGVSLDTMRSNLFPHAGVPGYRGVETFRELFGILFSATSGIFAGASMSGDLKNPSKAIPKGTLWAMAATFVLYLVVILSMASSITHPSFLRDTNIISTTSIWSPLILAGECATTFFSSLMGIIGGSKLLQALGRDKLLPGLSIFGNGNKRDDPILAIFVTYVIAQVSLFADLNQIATFISMSYQMTFFVMNLACFLLKIGSAPNFRPAFKFFSWHTAFVGSIISAASMFFIDETYAAAAICVLIFLFLILHYMSPPKHWGDVSQNLIYHQVRKYLLRLKPEHIKFWRPQIILLINDPRHHTHLIQFCNSLKKGSLYILGHVIVTDDFSSGIHEAKLQQSAWTRYISEFSRIKAFVQLTMSPSIVWGVRNLILSAGLGGMRPNIAILGFYNMDELRKSRPLGRMPEVPSTPTRIQTETKAEGKSTRRQRGDTSARLLDGFLPTDAIRTEAMMSVESYLTILEDLALRHRLNVAIGKGFQTLETPRGDGNNAKRYIDLWPIQMSAEITDGDKSIWTTNFDTYTLILQLGYILRSVPAWKKAFQLRVLVFVEYESEVKEEQTRLKALLEKLRIDATIRVFWLASGQLQSYESIVNGRGIGSGYGRVVDELLKDDEWWQELQRLRTEAHEMSRSQEIASLEQMLNATKRRGSSVSKSDGYHSLPRGLDVNEILERSKKPSVSAISKLGVNFGIHTHRLSSSGFGVRTDTNTPDFSDDDGESIASSDTEFNDVSGTATIADMGEISSSRRPSFLAFGGRRRSYGDILQRAMPSRSPEQIQGQYLGGPDAAISSGYGTMTPMTGATLTPVLPKTERMQSLTSRSGTAALPTETSPIVPKAPTRPTLSRNSSASRFTSNPTPETTVLVNDSSGSRITFLDAEQPVPTRVRRPILSRNASAGPFSSRPVPETKIEAEDDHVPRLTFAEPEYSAFEPPLRSRRNSASRSGGLSDAAFNIPELLASHRSTGLSDDESHSSYSTQSLPLSFNDLPSRAQHLILNELMRQHSSDTAVLFTTLPIPEEGTCKSEEASLRYLTDIEVLCHELPPVLLVLSNNMTVTVSL
ncbi:amino acid permease-domain-containing protein [Daldinia caldariorum]|uniref:amino acid permease-domain-containing protein n=1 Tax=Daldinia caldariorum TaxID=326644 RepID=UPI00200872AD|nr:amino acid permease-domain-containing protein [Daldinia caldariorum]KAI1466336.1 amino acid permease-domain-containing protein [Daldinia caldariorum]